MEEKGSKNNLSKSFEASILSDKIIDLIEKVSEPIFDSMLDEGLLKDFPIIGATVGLYKIGVSIKERIYLKKLYKFLYELRDVTQEEKENFLNRFSKEEDKTDFLEKILFLIERQDDIYKSTIVGKLFAKTLTEKISNDDFIRCTLIVDRTYIKDLEYFKLRYWDGYMPMDDPKNEKQLKYFIYRGDQEMINNNLVNSGLLDLKLEEIKRRQDIFGDEKKIHKKFTLSKMGKALIEFGF